MNSLSALLRQVDEHPEQIEFETVMQVIDEHYLFTPTAFVNGGLENSAGQNNGSCKILFFARLHALDLSQTLALFGSYYRDEVLKNPHGEDHQNIRHFMHSGWSGISFSAAPLEPR